MCVEGHDTSSGGRIWPLGLKFDVTWVWFEISVQSVSLSCRLFLCLCLFGGSLAEFHSLSSGFTFHRRIPRWQAFTTSSGQKGRACSWISSLTKRGRGEHEVKQRSDCQARQRSEKRGSRRRKQRYKQTPCNKFVFSRCQLPRPSLHLSVRSILCALASGRAAAINFTECNEPLIRLANGACNLAEAKAAALWIADRGAEKLCNCFHENPPWISALEVFFCEVQNLLEFVRFSVEIPNVWHGGGVQAAVSFCRFLLAVVSFGFLSQTGWNSFQSLKW